MRRCAAAGQGARGAPKVGAAVRPLGRAAPCRDLSGCRGVGPSAAKGALPALFGVFTAGW